MAAEAVQLFEQLATSMSINPRKLAKIGACIGTCHPQTCCSRSSSSARRQLVIWATLSQVGVKLRLILLFMPSS